MSENKAMKVESSSTYYQPPIVPKPSGPERKNHSQSKKRKKNSHEEKEPLFVIDKTRNTKLQYEPPSYKNNYPRNHSTSRPDIRHNACFNCTSTNHSLYNCPQPRNQRKIHSNRQMFLLNKQQHHSNIQNTRNKPANRRNVRYFVSGNTSPYIKFMPGILSSDLLGALGVPENEIPLHVYRMRQFGYPNGWLEEAKEEYSGISIFTEPNKCLPLPGRENEEMYYCNINEKKLHKYPGFNAPCSPNVVDKYEEIGCPKYNTEQSLKNMIEKLKCNKLKNELPKESIDSSSNGMLIEEQGINSKIVKEKQSKYPPSSPEDGEITDEDEIIEESLNIDKSLHNNENIELEKTTELSDTFGSCVEAIDLINNSQSCSSNSNSESISTLSSSCRKFGDIKSEVLGTPVLQRFSTYENRPTHEKFAKGMVDMIDHENLPNSVGTFKKLKEILIDVRTTLNNLLH